MGIVKSIKISFVGMLCFCLAGCGAETALVFIPIFSATWPVQGDEDYFIDLQPDDDNKNVESGVFEGEEIHFSIPEKDGNFLSGSFKGHDIQFTIQRPNNVNVKYTGTMKTASESDSFVTRIELHSSEGSLILVR